MKKINDGQPNKTGIPKHCPTKTNQTFQDKIAQATPIHKNVRIFPLNFIYNQNNM